MGFSRYASWGLRCDTAAAWCAWSEAVLCEAAVEVLMTPPLTVLVVTAVLAVALRVLEAMVVALGIRKEATGRRPAEAVG